MDIENLRTFHAVAQCKNIWKAAQELYISQSSVINRIRVLEKEIGHKLFYRNGRGTELTPEGVQLLRYTEKTLAVLELGLEELKNARNSSGHIQMASIPTAASYLLPSQFKRFRENFPLIDISLRTSYTTHIIDWVINGEVELGFVKGPNKYTGIKSIALFADPIVFVVNTHHPWAQLERITPSDFAEEEISVLPFNRKSLYWSSIIEWFDQQNVHLRTEMEFDHVETIKQMVLHNDGIAFVPRSSVEEELRLGYMKEVPLYPPLTLYRETLLICNKKKPLTAAAALFWDHLKKQL